MASGPPNRPEAVVAVVASAGGPLSHFAAGLPPEFTAAVLVVLHIPSQGPSVLPGILTRAGPLPARHPSDGDCLERGVIYVAPPDGPASHCQRRGRPGTSWAEGERSPSLRRRPPQNRRGDLWNEVGGSGSLRNMDDGAAGLRAVRVFGGLAIVQDPEEAAFPGMPNAALEAAETAVVSPVHHIGKRLGDWLAELELTPQEATIIMDDPPEGEPEGEITAFTCPDCGGSLWRMDLYGVERYRCRVGHSYSRDGLLVGKHDALEAALWAAIVALEEKADLCGRIFRRLEGAGRTSHLERYKRDIEATEHQLAFLRRMVEDLIAATPVLDEQGEAGARSAS